MRFPGPLLPGRFLERINRFSARVVVSEAGFPVGWPVFASGEMLAHVPNSGRLKELLLLGAPVWMAPPGWISASGNRQNLPNRCLQARARCRPPGRESRSTQADILPVQAPGSLQRADADRFAPNQETDPDFADVLEEAQSTGITVLAAGCKVSLDAIELATLLPVYLPSHVSLARREPPWNR